MAEARLAVAFQFQVTDEGIHLHFDKDAFKFVFTALFRSARRMVKRTRNAILKRSFPATPASWLVLVAAISAARYSQHSPTLGVLEKLERGIPGAHNLDPAAVIAVAVLLFATLLWMLMGHLLQFTLRQLLKYTGYLYEPRGKLSIKTKVWLGLVKCLGGRNPLLYSYQNSLPNLPVPDLDHTLKGYLDSVKPILSEDKHKHMQQLAMEFKNGIGKKLQRYLKLKYWWADNYVSDWWQQFVYLRSRSPLMINSNYYGVDSLTWETKVQSARAANFIHACLYYRQLLKKEKLEPQFAQGIIPLCSYQFKHTFNTTRIPGKEEDVIQHLHESSHVAIYCHGKLFKVQCYVRGKLLKPVDLQWQLQMILDDQSEPAPGEELLPALTSDNRSVWAETRSKYFSSGVNKVSLEVIEKAAFFMCLDDHEFDYSRNDTSQLDEYGCHAIHGDGHSIWFDKSVSITVYRNGRVAYNAEHSWADSPVVSYMAEWVTGDDSQFLGYTEDGNCKGIQEFPSVPPPTRLQWEIPAVAVKIIEASQSKAEELMSDLDLHLSIHSAFGKGAVKKCKMSPDAFIQLGFQLAYFKDQGHFNLTYEASMTRLYRHGRTETVRPCTMESCAFVKAMMNPDASNEEKKAFLVKAAEKHVLLYRKAMAGSGIDRHLFCLYVVLKYLEEESDFLKEALSAEWKLSTSQTPSGQTKKLDFNNLPEKVTAGGGFGPVADDGYGVSYIISRDDTIFFHVSCKKSSKLTDSKRFTKHIFETLMEMKNLFNV